MRLSVTEIPQVAACEPDDAVTCRLVYDWTENEAWADAATVLIGRPLAIFVLVVIGVVVRWLLHRLIDRTMRRLGGDPGAVARRAARAKTLASLLKSVVTVVVLTVVVIMVIDELGYQVAPLIASAGVVGLAIGFGAQSLVKDYLAGLFMVFEDQYGVGDVVDLGEASGTIEEVGLRVTQLRDVEGTVWYVRNGEILRVGNKSQNWARAVVDVGVAYSADLEQVRRVLGEAAHDVFVDPAFAGKLIEEPEVPGVEALTPTGVTVRVTVKTAPMEQWAVARELRERIRARFQAEGIDVPAVVPPYAGQPGAAAPAAPPHGPPPTS